MWMLIFVMMKTGSVVVPAKFPTLEGCQYAAKSAVAIDYENKSFSPVDKWLPGNYAVYGICVEVPNAN